MQFRTRSSLLAFLTTYFSLVPAAHAHAHIRQSIAIPMRDTPHTLAADVYLPAASGTWPVVLIQTPYNKNLLAPVFTLEFSDDPLLESPDYAFVVLDWRGFFASAGAAYSGNPTRGEDGYDAVQWIAAQTWCTGNVGTWGASALGNVQMQTAAEHPPALKACVPIVYHYGETYDQYYPGGVYYKSRNDFVLGTFGGSALVRSNHHYNTLWQFVESTTGDWSAIDLPMLHVSGWYDHETGITIREMQGVQTNGGPNAQGKQKLIIGPWTHGGIGALAQGELEYPAAEFYSSQAALDLFDHYLRGLNNGYTSRSDVEYFRMNDDQWIESSAWPPTGTTSQLYYLQPDGTLDSAASATPGAIAYTSDPSDPVPTVFGATINSALGEQGPGDLSAVEARPDVTTFTTPPLTAPLTFDGQPSVRLFFECDAVDTDFAVRLTHVYPDSRSMLIVDGIHRASLRNGFETREPLSDGVVYEVEVDLPPVSITIPAGHRLRVLVGPSNYDRFDKNMQDGSDLSDESGAVATTAQVTLHLSQTHPSSLTLPVVAPPVDSDGDGHPDTADAFPTRPDEWADVDSDGLGDNFEQLIINHNPSDAIATLSDVLPTADYDSDSFTNLQEFIDSTDPTQPSLPVPASQMLAAFTLAVLISLSGLRTMLKAYS
ncbi:MAG: CocE/NonD family hydrolase [Candidatus Hydrogenedentes bacterium]|nr:CocE/NonD family hydrolase [Candidatus Hydrogenedentota bacterium]